MIGAQTCVYVHKTPEVMPHFSWQRAQWTQLSRLVNNPSPVCLSAKDQPTQKTRFSCLWTPLPLYSSSAAIIPRSCQRAGFRKP